MASSKIGSSSGRDYQVFLSFRGPDTRTGFTNVLFNSLIDSGISVFFDNEELRVGERIEGSLLQAIDNSRIYIPIFSRTYATSKWCLRELEQIVANTFRSEGNKEILPIFLDVELDDVKLKTPLYRDAILNLGHEKNLSNEQVDAWRRALMEVDAIKGWELKNHKGYSELIKLVVEEVVEKLKTKHRLVTEHLVGINNRVAEVSQLLDINSGDVRLIKIYGMGGIGKTTIAKVIFNQLSSHFKKCCCFLEDVRANSSRTDGILELQKRLLYEIGVPTGTRTIDGSDYGMKRIGEALCNRKFFIVLDDVDSSEQVEKLIGKDTLCSGSRILITTRNKDVLRNHGLNFQISDYEMEVMNMDHGLELFCRHAFNKNSPSNDYYYLSTEVVSASGRLPLALEVIGSFLCHKQKKVWNDTLDKLRKAPHNNVFGKLKISYDALCFEQQQIFLDIACFFIGEDMTNAIYMWEDCRFFPKTGVDVLISMSLIKIMESNKFWMHDQLRDLGREIVHRENPTSPEERSRIWISDEAIDAIRTKKLSKNVQALYLDTYPRSAQDSVIQGEEIERFEHLRFLQLRHGTFAGDFANCFTKLKWISWEFPLPTYTWINMYVKNLVILELEHVEVLDDSRFDTLIKMARKLKVLTLFYCQNITRTPNFAGCPNIERLSFRRCDELRKIDRSIGNLKCLTHLKFKYCRYLQELPNEIGDLGNLKYFYVEYCEVKKLPDSILKLKSLREVHFFNFCAGLDPANSWELPSAIGMLENLEVLLVRSPNLGGQLPPEIERLTFLRILNLSRSRVSRVPKTVSMLPRLRELKLKGCNQIQELPMLPTSLTHLQVSSASLQVVPDLSKLTNLEELELNNSGGEGKKCCMGDLGWIGMLSKLRKLKLELHNVSAPTNLSSLPMLDELDMFGLDLKTFPQLPSSLQKLGLDAFDSTVSLSPNLINLSRLELYGAPLQQVVLDGLQLPHLGELRVKRCVFLERLRLSSLRKLKETRVEHCAELVEIQFSWELESLEVLLIEGCKSLGRLVYGDEAGDDNNELISSEGRLTLPSTALNRLRSFMLRGCHKIVEVQVVGTSESWKAFELLECPYVRCIGGLSNLKNLCFFSIVRNNQMRAVEGLNELQFLDHLKVRDNPLLEKLIDISSTKLPDACFIAYRSSGKLGGITKEFHGSLQSLKHYKETNQRRRLGRVSFLLKIGFATCLSALFLSKALHMNKKRIKASGR